MSYLMGKLQIMASKQVRAERVAVRGAAITELVGMSLVAAHNCRTRVGAFP